MISVLTPLIWISELALMKNDNKQLAVNTRPELQISFMYQINTLIKVFSKSKHTLKLPNKSFIKYEDTKKKFRIKLLQNNG